MKVLLDTNVILDIALDRQPFVECATRLLEVATQYDITLYVTATTITDLYYVTRRAKGRAIARSFIVELLQYIKVVEVNGAVIEEALSSDIVDFEDAVQESAAKSKSIPVIVTRNEEDFQPSSVEIHTPQTFLDSL